MKKGLCVLMGCAAIYALASCSSKPELILLNWNDYISSDVVEAFEEEYNCTVTELTETSNETMYTDILNQRVAYDIAIPSDYMIDKLQQAGLLQEIDFTKLSNYSEDMFVEELQELMYNDENNHYSSYYIPYFWGSLGIMYSTAKYPEIESIIEEHGWAVFFEEDLLPEGATVAMYDSSRDAFAVAELYLGYSLNTTDTAELDACAELIKNRNFTRWGTDDLKVDVAAGNIDVALVYSGDFFDAYYADLEGDNPDNVENYGIYCPTDSNNVFYDGMVIPTTSTQTDLAYEFINYFLDFDNSYANAEAVGYTPTLQSVYDYIFDSEDWEDVTSIDAYDPTIIVNTAGSKAEVYLNLSDATYEYMENLYNFSIRFN